MLIDGICVVGRFCKKRWYQGIGCYEILSSCIENGQRFVLNFIEISVGFFEGKIRQDLGI